MNPSKQNAPAASPSIPYRPLPPITTVANLPSRRPTVSVLGTAEKELTSDQIENWRKVIAIQINPLAAQFLSDDDVRWYAKEIQLVLREKADLS